MVSTAELINLWSEAPDGVYSGYCRGAASLPAGLDRDRLAAAAATRSTLNWLNLFYAVEWALFAGFAVYLWYRLVRDVWERECTRRRKRRRT